MKKHVISISIVLAIICVVLLFICVFGVYNHYQNVESSKAIIIAIRNDDLESVERDF